DEIWKARYIPDFEDINFCANWEYILDKALEIFSSEYVGGSKYTSATIEDAWGWRKEGPKRGKKGYRRRRNLDKKVTVFWLDEDAPIRTKLTSRLYCADGSSQGTGFAALVTKIGPAGNRVPKKNRSYDSEESAEE
ncbi:hypothetical protein CVT24_001948, partial [Panaeolus cyanescens]